MRNKVFVDAGTEGSLGRIAKAYPKKGVSPPAHPITRDEAASALDYCGIRMSLLDKVYLRPYPLVPREGDAVGITVNPVSDNGFPVLGKWKDPGAAEKCMGLAKDIRAQLERAHREGPNGVWRWLRGMEATNKELVAVRGKTKGDYYSPEKVERAEMRFYNAFPRQMMLNMQVATQVMEMNARPIAVDNLSRSAIGKTLVRGGADELVEALDWQLSAHGAAYVHVGDDSWVIVRRGERLAMFALDCSNFDLTQHATVTAAVHEVVRDELRLIDPVAAELWYAYARERIVVVAGSMVRRFKHAGPSGMPLQSKVNDMLMDVMIRRTLKGLDTLDETAVATRVEQAGSGMGFVVRLEQYWEGDVRTLRDALAQRPFLFVGYYFHVEEGRVKVHCDVPRMLAQLPYPTTKWMRKEEVPVKEAMRLGSIYMNLGLPTSELVPAFEEYRRTVEHMLEDALAKYGDRNEPALKWAVQEVANGPPLEPSLSGLLAAVRRPPEALWDVPAQEQAREAVASAVWADMVEAEEREADAAVGLTRDRPAEASVRPIRVPVGRANVRPATLANDGRPPPTSALPRLRVPRYVGGGDAPTLARGRDRRNPFATFWMEQYYSDEESELETVSDFRNYGESDDELWSRRSWRS
jgi:hypothetical protein